MEALSTKEPMLSIKNFICSGLGYKTNRIEELRVRREGIKKGKSNIAPLRPPTLATFRSWGSSAGAGRADLPVAKVSDHGQSVKRMPRVSLPGQPGSG